MFNKKVNAEKRREEGYREWQHEEKGSKPRKGAKEVPRRQTWSRLDGSQVLSKKKRDPEEEGVRVREKE